jgi:hypothetical protein
MTRQLWNRFWSTLRVRPEVHPAWPPPPPEPRGGEPAPAPRRHRSTSATTVPLGVRRLRETRPPTAPIHVAVSGA